MRPCFITFEGLDGSGKSTQLRRLVRRLEEAGTPFVVTQEPGGTPLGEELRRLFLGHEWGEVDGTVETLLVFASRRQQLKEVIEPALAAGRHVLCDRFTDSTLVYQGRGRGLSEEMILAVDRVATGGRRPDRTLLFDLPAAQAQRRGTAHGRRTAPGGGNRFDREGLDFYERVRHGYLELAEGEPERFRVIPATGTIEETELRVLDALADVLGGVA